MIVITALFTQCRRSLATCGVGVLLLSTMGSASSLSLAPLFSDNMVLQQKVPAKIWGSALPGEPLTIRLGDASETLNASAEGRWMVSLAVPPCGGPYELVVEGGADTLRVRNVLVGEVWLCSGQSNMQWRVAQSANAESEQAMAHYDAIRLFTVDNAVDSTVQRECRGHWAVCSPRTVGDFSAVGYYFARRLHTELQVPVGIISSSWGGTAIESWLSEEVLRTDTLLQDRLNWFMSTQQQRPEQQLRYQSQLAQWDSTVGKLPKFHTDPGTQGEAGGYAAAGFDDASWSAIEVPGPFEDSLDGVAWLRKSVTLPPSLRGMPLSLHLGFIDDYDISYVNGQRVGAVEAGTQRAQMIERVYAVPASLNGSERLTIAIRVFDRFGEGGMMGPASALYVTAPGSVDTVRLAGTWHCHFSQPLSPHAIRGPLVHPPYPPLEPLSPHRPAGLFNAMIHPLAPYALRGFAWYQGESNVDRSSRYAHALQALISSWREAWGDQTLPFGIIQLANYQTPDSALLNGPWALLREAQLLTAQRVANTGLVVTIDIGDAASIHPLNKQDVGKRLGGWALATVYHKTVAFRGPRPLEMRRRRGSVVLTFDPGEGKLQTNGPALQGFFLAGPDSIYYAAHATLRANQVILSATQVPSPRSVRYGWAMNPTCTLCNSAGLPASPFRMGCPTRKGRGR